MSILRDMPMELQDRLLLELEAAVKKSPNQCGDCSMCCTLMDVVDEGINKPMNTRCEHLDSCGGCAIYEKRPHLCRSFYCVWMLSPLFQLGIPDKLKPTECGFVMHWDLEKSPLLMTCFVDPQNPNAWVKHKRTLETIARKHDVAIAIGGGEEATHIVTPIGNWYAKTDYPYFFNGTSVGVPRQDYRRAV